MEIVIHWPVQQSRHKMYPSMDESLRESPRSPYNSLRIRE